MTDSPYVAPPWIEPRTAYVHVPFCGHQCGYCDFAVTAGQDHLIELYLDAIDLELQVFGTPRPVETLFIGGGTPTYLSAPQLRRLLTSLRAWLPLRNYESHEYSIESTPESLNAEKVATLAEFGVNRVSIGVQSFQSHLLKSLDRQHGVEQIARSIDTVRERIPAISLDLIFAVPGQTLAEWERDLAAALAFRPEHLSTYGLTYEKGTPLWKSRERGAVRSLGESDELDMYRTAIDRLATAGYEHYEISNFARPGHRCRHNERYWANEAYHGVGVGSARYVGGVRSMNVRNTKLYLRRMLAGESPTFQSESLPPRESAFETLAVQLRRSDGINRMAFRDQTGFALDDLIREPLAFYVGQGFIEDDGQSIRLTNAGKPIGDGLIERFMKSQ